MKRKKERIVHVKDHVSSYHNLPIWEECHSGTVLAFRDDKTKIKVYGGGRARGLEIYNHSIVIDVGAGINNPHIIDFDPPNLMPKLRCYESARKDIGIIKIHLRDGGAPDLPSAFWYDLVSSLREENKDVIVCCIGGHGRTGLVLSILAYFMCEDAKKDPIAFIRKNYCKEAVETAEQVKYIEEITDVLTRETPTQPIYREIGYLNSYDDSFVSDVIAKK